MLVGGLGWEAMQIMGSTRLEEELGNEKRIQKGPGKTLAKEDLEPDYLPLNLECNG